MDKKRNFARNPDALASAWERQNVLVKQEQQALSAATDAKTARLKALRLEKEQQEASVGPKPASPAKRSGRQTRAAGA